MSDLLSAISVLLVFLTFLINGIDEEVSTMMDKRIPTGESEKTRYSDGLLKLLLVKVIPVAIAFLLVFYSLAPRSYNIISNSELSFIQFNELDTIFIFIETGLFGFIIFTCYKAYLLVDRWFRL